MATSLPAKSHKTAEKCIRLLQKKRRSREKVNTRLVTIFLVSWANAPALVQYLAEAPHVCTKAVVLCDMCGYRVRESAERWAKQYPFVERIAGTWTEAVEAAAALAAGESVAEELNSAPATCVPLTPMFR